MKVLLIPDKFKGSLSAEGVIQSVSTGIQRADPGTEMYSVLASDGGDGFLKAVSNYIQLDEVLVSTIDPLGRKMQSPYLLNRSTNTAYVELAQASGLELLKNSERNVMHTSTLGTGIQIKDAISKGATTIYVGLGGSATNDGGIGIAKALGYSFLEIDGNEIEPIGQNLSKIHKIEHREEEFEMDTVSFIAVNDVNNPLFGKNGAAFVYAQQKGASNQEIELLDNGLEHLAQIVKEQLGKDEAFVPGTGAAGGTAYGLRAFLNAEFITGIDFILGLAKVDELLNNQKFDYIITGEGRFDDQTLYGKLIKGVIDLGNRFNIPVIAVCGILDIDEEKVKTLGLRHIIEIRDPSKPIQYSIENAAMLIENATYKFFMSIDK